MDDIVVDTNVFLHANNASTAWYRESNEFLLMLLGWHDLVICVDEGWSDNEADNHSIIGSEYHNNIGADTLGYQILVALGVASRIKTVSKAVPNGIRQEIDKRMSNQRDKVFLKVAINSLRQRLVSHDFADFHDDLREFVRATWGVDICVASDVG